MSLITLSSEDCEMIEKCVDMISMQCKMIANMLRRSRDASGAVPSRRQDTSPSEGNEGMADMLNNAVSTLSSAVRQVSSEMDTHSDPQSAARKRARMRHGSALPESFDDSHLSAEALSLHTTTPPPAKRRGRPPRDYGDELGPAFAMYASENYSRAEQSILARAGAATGTRIPKNEVLRAVWDTWWLSAQAMKDKYLTLSRHEMAVNETHMLELLLDFPLPTEAVAAQASLRHGNSRTISRSPEPISAFEIYLREQVPLLRSKVPDWSDAEIHRRLSVNWTNMSSSDRERYNSGATLVGASPLQQSYPGSSTTPANINVGVRGYSMSAGQKSGSRSWSQSTPRRAYVLFCRQERPLLVHANPEWDLPTVNKELGRKWKELTPDQKEVFYDLERKESESRAVASSLPISTHIDGHGGELYGIHGSAATGMYQKNGNQFNGAFPTTPTGPGSGRDYGSAMLARAGGRPGILGSGNPHKGPSKAYVFYSRMNRKSVTTEHPDWDLATVNRELGRMWKVLGREERQSWEERAAVGAGISVDTDSASSTPYMRESPAAAPGTGGVAVTSSMVAPLPMPAALSMNSEPTISSIPATPASGTATPTTKEEPVQSGHPGLDGEGEGEAEDVEMQDEDTEDEEMHNTYERTRVPSEGAAYTSSPTVYSGQSSASHGPSAAPIKLPIQATPITSVARPPPTAKPAAIAISNDTGAVRLDTVPTIPSSSLQEPMP
ncbi:hypothetical protein H4S08_001712 [Coemansia sp. RSA 1365]|nr:hypothetical protein H4S08_001712 [Coemansia sp. RSA 1365]